MKYIYPSDITAETKKRWSSVQKIYKNISEPNFPIDIHLQNILDVIYHSSFTTEESRKTAVRIAYVHPKDVDTSKNFINHHSPPIKLLKCINYNVGELLKIAPAFNPNYSILVVAPHNEVSSINDESNPLVIWGVMNIGQDYFDLINGRESAALSPPNFLTISVTAPGFITISTGGQILFRVRNGQVVYPTIDEISESIIGNYLQDTAKDLYIDVCKELKVKKYAKDDSNEYPFQLYFRTIANIMRQTREHFHGGTYIIVPNELTIEDERLKDRVSLKYQIEPVKIWDELIAELVASRKYFNKVFNKNISLVELKENVRFDSQRENAEQKIFEFEFFASKLSGVDGVVLLNKKLDILGFGGEIIASSNSLQTVRKALDPFGKKWKEVSIQAFGTRHRSALRFCSSYENSCAFVISQDGSVRAIKREGAFVYMWDEITISSFGY